MEDMVKLLVTTYKDPDLDGTACAFGYAEFLNKNNKNAIAAVFWTPHRESQFVLKEFNIPDLRNAESLINNINWIIIVDASDLRGLSNQIQPEKVIEVIDHRKSHEAHNFPNAKIQIELVGSAATLIAEKFYLNKIAISKEAAALLFSAIISNTINFQANVTTKRDHEMSDWLQTKFHLPVDYIHKMFLDKSQFRKTLKETLIDDFATFHFNNQNLGIAQLEIINVNNFIKENSLEIKRILEELKKEKWVELIFLTCIDLENACNQIIVVDKSTENLVKEALKITFKNGISKRNGIIMRKEIVPLIKEILEISKVS